MTADTNEPADARLCRYLCAWRKACHALVLEGRVDDLVELLLSTCLDICRGDAGSVLIWDPEEQRLRIRAARGLSEEIVRNTRIRLGERIAGLTARQRAGFLVDSDHPPPSFNRYFQPHRKIGRAISVPLAVSEELLGVLNVSHRRNGDGFGDTDLQFLSAFAGQAAQDLAEAKRVKELSEAATAQFQWEKMQFRLDRLSAMGLLAAALAHDIRNPLQGALFSIEALREAIPEGEPLREEVDTVERELSRAAAVVSTFMGIAQEDTNSARRLRAEPEETDVNEVVRRCLAYANSELRARQITVRCELSSKLSPAACPVSHAQQVFLNLILNAAQALEGSEHLTVTTRPAGDGFVEVAFADSGPGVPAAIRSRIFEPFYTTKGENEGTGLGLPVARRLVEVNGGSLELDPSVAQGARFVVRLPVASPGGEADPGGQKE